MNVHSSLTLVLANFENSSRVVENKETKPNDSDFLDDLLHETEIEKKLEKSKPDIYIPKDIKPKPPKEYKNIEEELEDYIFGEEEKPEIKEEELDPDELLKELQTIEEYEKNISDELSTLLSDAKNAHQKPLIVLKKDRRYSSYEMVKEQIAYFNKVKSDRLCEVPHIHMLRVRAIGDFDPQKLYRKEELETMLDFKKGDEIFVIAAFTSDWLLGFKTNQVPFLFSFRLKLGFFL